MILVNKFLQFFKVDNLIKEQYQVTMNQMKMFQHQIIITFKFASLIIFNVLYS